MTQFSLPSPKRAKATTFGLVIAVGLVAGLGACSRVPEIENQLTKDLRAQPYPHLLPLATAVPAQTPPDAAAAPVQEDLDARARRLKARAAALRKRTP
ncbi:MAG: hypothetical protein MJH10_06835 [Epibacterium sp.]|nr:hypothetical protein [Epibacterium sp.]